MGMKVCFLIPPQLDGLVPADRTAGCTRITYPAPNIYELTVAAAVRRLEDVEVVYADFISHTTDRAHFEKAIAADDADCYCIWTVNLSLDNDLDAVRAIRRLRGDIPVIFMGPGATFYIHRALADENVYVVRGEPDATAVELIDALAHSRNVDGIAGVSMLRDGKVVSSPTRPLITDLDALPFPARDLLGDTAFHNPKLKTGPYTTMVTSRNCPYHCIYCVPSSLTFAREIEHRAHNAGRKPPISFRSVESIEREVAELAVAGYRAIGFMDDNFIWTEQRTLAICDIMKRYGMVWGCEARVDAITEPIARALGESNCRYIDLGVESFDDRILDYIHKGIKVADIYRAIELLQRYGVPVKLNVLIGSSPLETRDTVLHTLREAKRLKVDQVMFNIVSPFPGTEFYDMAKANGWIEGGEYRPTDVQRNSILNLPHLSSREMEKLLRHNNLSYFLSPRFIGKHLWRFRSWSEFAAAAKAMKRKLFG